MVYFGKVKTMASIVPFFDVEQSPEWQGGDIDRKREILKSWYAYNSDIVKGDSELEDMLQTTANKLVVEQDIGATGWESVGDAARTIVPAIGGTVLGGLVAASTLGIGAGAVPVGAVAGGILGETLQQRAAMERGTQFGGAPLAALAFGAANAVPGGSFAGRALRPLVKEAGKTAAKFAVLGAGGNAIEQQELRGEINPTEVAMAGALTGVGGGLLDGGVMLGQRVLRGRAQGGMPVVDLAAMSPDDLTTDSLARVTDFKAEEALSRDAQMAAARAGRREEDAFAMAEARLSDDLAAGDFDARVAMDDAVPVVEEPPIEATLSIMDETPVEALPAAANPAAAQMPEFTPSLVAQADAAQGGSMEAVNAAANQMSGATPVAREGARGDQFLAGVRQGQADEAITPVDDFTSRNVGGAVDGEVVPVMDEAAAMGRPLVEPVVEEFDSAGSMLRGVAPTTERVKWQNLNKLVKEGEEQFTKATKEIKGNISKAERRVREAQQDANKEALQLELAQRRAAVVNELGEPVDRNAAQALADYEKALSMYDPSTNVRGDIINRFTTGQYGGRLSGEMDNALGIEAEAVKVRIEKAGKIALKMADNEAVTPAERQFMNDTLTERGKERLVEYQRKAKATVGGKVLNESSGVEPADELLEGFNESFEILGDEDTNGALQAITDAFNRGAEKPPAFVYPEYDKESVRVRMSAAERAPDKVRQARRAERLAKQLSDAEVAKGGAMGIRSGALPSAGEPLLGGVAGFLSTTQDEGESDEEFAERRLNNALLGMGVATLGAAGIRRLAKAMGVEPMGMDLEKLGAAVQKPAKKRTRAELMAEYIALNEAAAAAQKGTIFENMSAGVAAAAAAGPVPGFDVKAAVAAREQARKVARLGERAGETFMDKVSRKPLEVGTALERTFSSSTDKIMRRLEKTFNNTNYDFNYFRAKLNNFGKNHAKGAESFIDNELLPLSSVDGTTVGESSIMNFLRTPFFGESELMIRAKAQGVTPAQYGANLDTLLEAKLAKNLYGRGYTADEVGNLMTEAEADAFIGAFGKDYEASARFINDGYKRLLDKKVENGMLSKEDADFWTKLSPDYVPYNRIFSEDELTDMGSGFARGGNVIGSLSKAGLFPKREGSSRMVASPIDGLFTHAATTFSQMGKNIAAKSMADALYMASKIDNSIVSKPLFRVSAQDTALYAKGTVFDLGDGKFQLMGEGNVPVKDIDGLSVFLDKSQVRETSEGNFVGDGKIINSGDATGEHVLTYMEDGNQLKMVVSKEVEDAMKGLGVAGVGILGRLMRIPTSISRAGFVGLSAPFAAMNVFVDTTTSIINTKGYSGLNDLAGGYAKSLTTALSGFGGTDNELRELYRRTQSNFFQKDILRDASKDRPNFSKLIKPVTTIDWNTPMDIFKKMEDFVGVSEEITRLKIFQLEANQLAQEALAKGAKIQFDPKTRVWTGEDDAITRIYTIAGEQSMERTANYINRGNWSTGMNSVFLFFHANVAGTRANVRAARRDPMAWAIKVLGGVGGGLAAATYYNLSSPERAEVYTNIPESDRQNNLLLVAPNGERDDEGNPLVLRIKLPPGIGRVAQTVRRAVEGAYGFGQETGTMDYFTKAGADLLAFGVPLGDSGASTLVPQGLKPLVEASDTFNRNLFSGQQVVSRQLQDLPSEDQFDSRTSLTARAVGRALGVSPVKLDYIGKGYAGGLFEQAIQLSDKAVAAVTGQDAADGKGRGVLTQVVQRFTKGQQGEQLNRFYAKMDAATETKKGLDVALARGDTARADQLLEAGIPQLVNYEILTGIRTKIMDNYGQIRQLENVSMDRAEKAELVLMLRNTNAELARIGVTITDKMEADLAAREAGR